MIVKYQDIEANIEHILNLTDRQEFTLQVIYGKKKGSFLLEGFRKDPEDKVTWLLKLVGTRLVKPLEDMRSQTVYNAIMEMI